MTYIPATYSCMKCYNHLLFLWSEALMLQIRPQIISPSQPTALPTSLQPYNKMTWTHTYIIDKIIIIIIIKITYFFPIYNEIMKIVLKEKKEPAFFGTEVQLPIPWVLVYAISFKSSSSVQRPLFTLDLSQHGGLPISLS